MIAKIPHHLFPGTCKERQMVGDPGYDEASLAVGHVAAHPDLGCGDVGCDVPHDDAMEAAARAELGEAFGRRGRALGLEGRA